MWPGSSILFFISRGDRALLPRSFLHSDRIDRPTGRDRPDGGIRRRIRSEWRSAGGNDRDDAGEFGRGVKLKTRVVVHRIEWERRHLHFFFFRMCHPLHVSSRAVFAHVQYPNFVSEEWSHVLTWDLFVGRWIWLDGLKRGVFTSHSVLLTNLIGPPGLLLHWSTCALTGRGFLPPSDTME